MIINKKKKYLQIGIIRALVPESTRPYFVIPVIGSPLTSIPTIFITQK